MRRPHGFTLVEILIGCGLLALFLTGAFAIYRSGSESFLLGNWKLQAQKEAQRFLAMLAADLAQANKVVVIEAENAVVVASTPIHITSSGFSEEGAAFVPVNVRTAAWTPLVFFSISRPCVRASIFSPARAGRWKGVSLWAMDGKILYTRTGDPNAFSTTPANLPGPVVDYRPPSLGAGSDFESAPATEDFRNIVLEDVESIGFQRKVRSAEEGKSESVLHIRVLLRRPRLAETTTVAESTDATILNETMIQTF